MEPLSEQRLAPLPSEFANAVRAAHDALVAATGNGFRVAEGARSAAQSDADYALGRTILTKPDGSPQGIVTDAPGGHSWHNFNLAVDCYPFTHGDAGALDWNPKDAEFQAMVRALQAQGLVWGGCWHSMPDAPHFQSPKVPVSPTDADRAAFATGGIAAVWARYGITS